MAQAVKQRKQPTIKTNWRYGEVTPQHRKLMMMLLTLKENNNANGKTR